MYYQGTGKAAHGFRISVVMDDRFLLGFAVGNYRSVAKIEKAAIEAANERLAQYGLAPIESCEKSRIISAFFAGMNREFLDWHEYRTAEELDALVAEYMDIYNNDRPHSSLGYKTPSEVWRDAHGLGLRLV